MQCKIKTYFWLAEHVLPQWAASQALTSPRGQAPGPRRTRTTWPGAWWNGGLSAPSASAVRERAREGGGRGRGRRVRCSTREAECPGTQAHAGGGTTGAPDAGPIDCGRGHDREHRGRAARPGRRRHCAGSQWCRVTEQSSRGVAALEPGGEACTQIAPPGAAAAPLRAISSPNSEQRQRQHLRPWW